MIEKITMIVIKRLFLVIAIVPVYVFAMEFEQNSSIEIPPISKTVQLPNGGTEKYHRNGMIEQLLSNKTIIERHYLAHESNILLEHWNKNPSNEYSQANPSYASSDLHMKITNTQITLTPDDAEYIADHNILPEGSAFGTFMRENQIVKTVAYPDESFVEDSETSLNIITNTEKYDSRRREQFKRIQSTDKSNKTKRNFALLASDYAPNNPIVEYMQQRKTTISQNTTTSSTTISIEDVFAALKI